MPNSRLWSSRICRHAAFVVLGVALAAGAIAVATHLPGMQARDCGPRQSEAPEPSQRAPRGSPRLSSRPTPSTPMTATVIAGTCKDERGNPLAGVAVFGVGLDGAPVLHTTSAVDGSWSLRVTAMPEALGYCMAGFLPGHRVIRPGTTGNHVVTLRRPPVRIVYVPESPSVSARGGEIVVRAPTDILVSPYPAIGGTYVREIRVDAKQGQRVEVSYPLEGAVEVGARWEGAYAPVVVSRSRRLTLQLHRSGRVHVIGIDQASGSRVDFRAYLSGQGGSLRGVELRLASGGAATFDTGVGPGTYLVEVTSRSFRPWTSGPLRVERVGQKLSVRAALERRSDSPWVTMRLGERGRPATARQAREWLIFCNTREGAEAGDFATYLGRTSEIENTVALRLPSFGAYRVMIIDPKGRRGAIARVAVASGDDPPIVETRMSPARFLVLGRHLSKGLVLSGIQAVSKLLGPLPVLHVRQDSEATTLTRLSPLAGHGGSIGPFVVGDTAVQLGSQPEGGGRTRWTLVDLAEGEDAER